MEMRLDKGYQSNQGIPAQLSVGRNRRTGSCKGTLGRLLCSKESWRLRCDRPRGSSDSTHGQMGDQALVPDQSPLHMLLRHRLSAIHPPNAGTWPTSLQWLFLHKFSAPVGSPLWNRLISSWRRLSPFVDATPPATFEELQNTSLWWTSSYIGVNFGFPIRRARQLARKGMRCLRDLWTPSSTTPEAWPVLQQRFGLQDAEQPQVEQFFSNIPPAWLHMATSTQLQSKANEWLGVFTTADDEVPTVLLCTTSTFHPPLNMELRQVSPPPQVPLFIAGIQSRSLIELPQDARPRQSKAI